MTEQSVKLDAVTVNEEVEDVERIAPLVERVKLVNAQLVTVEVEGREKRGWVSVVRVDGVATMEVS